MNGAVRCGEPDFNGWYDQFKLDNGLRRVFITSGIDAFLSVTIHGVSRQRDDFSFVSVFLRRIPSTTPFLSANGDAVTLS